MVGPVAGLGEARPRRGLGCTARDSLATTAVYRGHDLWESRHDAIESVLVLHLADAGQIVLVPAPPAQP